MFNKMLYLLLLAVLTVPVAHADKCKGLTPNADFPNVCEPDEFRTDGNRKKLGNEACNYKSGCIGDICAVDCSLGKKSTSSLCRQNCDYRKKVGTLYYYKNYIYQKNPCNNNTGFVAQSDTSKFLCKNGDTGFLCKNDDKDDEVYYCGCKNAKGGTFSKTCYYTTDEENTVITLTVILLILALCHGAYVYIGKPDETNRFNKAWVGFFCLASIILVVLNISRLTTESAPGIFVFGMIVALCVLAAESYYIYDKWYKPFAEQGASASRGKPTGYRDDRFNVI